jgi:hypothetical protein
MGQVVAEQLGFPMMLADAAASFDLCEPGFDAEERGAVDGLQLFDVQVEVVEFDEAATGAPLAHR